MSFSEELLSDMCDWALFAVILAIRLLMTLRKMITLNGSFFRMMSALIFALVVTMTKSLFYTGKISFSGSV